MESADGPAMIRVSAKSRGLTSVSDLGRAKGREAEALRSVDELDLSENHIDSLLFDFQVADGASNAPTDGTSALAAFCSLQRLELRSNSLGRTSLLGIGAIASSLCFLDVSNNELESLQGLSVCTSLTYIDVSKNRLRHLDELPNITRGSTTEAFSFTIIASENRIASSTKLEADLLQTVGRVISKMDVSHNHLESPPVRLLGLSRSTHRNTPGGNLSIGVEDAEDAFSQLKHVSLSYNPFLINGKMETMMESVARHVILSANIDELIAMSARMSCLEWCRAVDSLPKGSGHVSWEVVANGRREADESSWRASIPRLLAVLRKTAKKLALQESDPSVLTADSEELAISGHGRTSAYRCHGKGSAHTTGLLPSTTNSTATSSSSRQSSPGQITAEECGASVQSSASFSKPRYYRDAVQDHTLMVDQSVAQQTNELLRRENRRISKQLQDSLRIQREQLQTIRELQADHARDLEVIHEVQDRLKRKSAEHACASRRAHEVEARLVALQAEIDMRSHSRQPRSRMHDVLEQQGDVSQSVRQAAAVTFNENDEELSLRFAMDQRVFHMSVEERARLIESRSLSKHLSSSYNENGLLLPGRYSHAHKSYVYQQDLDVPTEERVRLQNISSKHNIEHDQQNIKRRAGTTSSSSSIVSPRLHHRRRGAREDAGNDDDEFVRSLVERVCQLETMYDAQSQYCDDLSHENDELIQKYERLINLTTMSAEEGGAPKEGGSHQ